MVVSRRQIARLLVCASLGWPVVGVGQEGEPPQRANPILSASVAYGWSAHPGLWDAIVIDYWDTWGLNQETIALQVEYQPTEHLRGVVGVARSSYGIVCIGLGPCRVSDPQAVAFQTGLHLLPRSEPVLRLLPYAGAGLGLLRWDGGYFDPLWNVGVGTDLLLSSRWAARTEVRLDGRRAGGDFVVYLGARYVISGAPPL